MGVVMKIAWVGSKYRSDKAGDKWLYWVLKMMSLKHVDTSCCDNQRHSTQGLSPHIPIITPDNYL